MATTIFSFSSTRILLREFIKDNLYFPPVPDITHLRARFTAAVAKVTLDVLRGLSWDHFCAAF
jgi:hypothetical protein